MVDIENELVGPVREFLDRSFGAEHRLAMLESEGEAPKLWGEFADLGWFALTAPQEDDGLGMHPSQLAHVFRTFGERLLTGAMLEQMLLPGLLLSTVRDSAGDRQALPARLSAALQGQARIAVADPRVTLHWSDVNGSLALGSGTLHGGLEIVRFGALADEILVIADDGSGETVVLLEAGRSGVTAKSRSSADPGASFASVRFDDVRVDDEDVVARGEAAAALASRIRAWQRLLISCELAGIARHMLDLSVGFIQQREQFGRPVAGFQAIRHIAATAAQRTILLENFCDAVADDARSLTDGQFDLATLSLKATASETARLVCEDALQMHGGIGFTYEYELHWYYKRALSLRTWYGDERELATEVGRRRLSA